jgi:hypothetical protein
MSLRGVGGQVLDDERHCIVCAAHAVAEPYQTTLPGKVADLRAQAQAYARLAEEKAAEADALQAEIETAQPHAYICGPHKALLPAHLRGPWSPTGAWSVGLPMGGRLSAEPGSQAEAHAISRTLVPGARTDQRPSQRTGPARKEHNHGKRPPAPRPALRRNRPKPR